MHCPKSFTYYEKGWGDKNNGSGTSNLLKHMVTGETTCPYFLQFPHDSSGLPIINPGGESEQMSHNNKTKGGFQPLINQHSSGAVHSQVVVETFTDDLMRTAITEWIVLDKLPFSAANRDGFRRLMSVSRPFYKLVDQTTFRRV
jgi:hypothetical protein